MKFFFQLFLSSNVDENQCLNSDGLFLLCEKLKLSAFAATVAERVLCGADVVDFYYFFKDFKDRFVSYLPEIIDVSSGTVDPLLAWHNFPWMCSRLTRYEIRLLCENTPNLVQLSIVDINSLFEHADIERTGRISVQQFIAQYRLQKRLSAEVHFIADSFISSLNLFEALDSANSGSIDSHDLLQYWNKAGLRIDEGIVVLKVKTEERYRTRFIQMEDKFRLDKREIQHEVEQLEEELSRLRQIETSTKNKVMLLERQNSRLLEENREQSEAMSQLEQAVQSHPVEENGQLILYKQKLEIVVAHNKMMLIRKRRLAKGDTLSEMESEPESIFIRHRRRRLLKRKERRMRHERIASRLHMQDSVALGNSGILGSELNRICNEHKQELIAVRQTAAKTLAEALNDQQKQLTLQLERERRQWEVRLITEKNQLEKNFAEEKMKLMNRLQEDFDAELQRISSIVNRSDDGGATEHYKQQIKTLEFSLESQKKSYEKRLVELQERFKNSINAHNNVFIPENRTANVFSLLEKYRNSGPSQSEVFDLLASRSSLSVEKHNQTGIHSFNRSLSNVVARCEKCDLTEMRLRELYHTVVGDHTLSESGIEDFSSSAGSHVDDKVVLKREIRKLKGRLEATKDKLTELRILHSVLPSRHKNSLCGNEGNDVDFRRTFFQIGDARGVIEKLGSENVILEARLSEAQQLIKTLVDQYNMQLDETARVGAILRDVYLHPNMSSDVSQKAPS
ncbi:unnamed protein product [Angiostrongylus costaricensis]|uniref:EF-hand domain-containing protein n=1 Tax=Angiostrongylus costaricensis TaxID=334426 RepID=A0A0R3Q2D1_ANGCS|nr:unnamed protein product [Angiostrongylus costaricensis]